MDAKTLLEQNGTVTVSDLVAAGVDRHTARHQFEKLVAEGIALKITEGKKVSYSLVLPLGLTALGVPPEAAPVLPHLRANKALSVARIARRSGLSVPEVRLAVAAAVACGLAIKPFQRSNRYQRAC